MDVLSVRVSYAVPVPSPFWCERLALVQPGDKREGNRTVLQEDDQQIWQDMRLQLNDVLAQEQTLQAFMA